MGAQEHDGLRHALPYPGHARIHVAHRCPRQEDTEERRGRRKTEECVQRLRTRLHDACDDAWWFGRHGAISADGCFRATATAAVWAATQHDADTRYARHGHDAAINDADTWYASNGHARLLSTTPISAYSCDFCAWRSAHVLHEALLLSVPCEYRGVPYRLQECTVAVRPLHAGQLWLKRLSSAQLRQGGYTRYSPGYNEISPSQLDMNI